MEALLQWGLANKTGMPNADQTAATTPHASMTSLEKDMSNLVVNDNGGQKYIGKLAIRFHIDMILLMRIMTRAFIRFQHVLATFTSLGKAYYPKVLDAFSCAFVAIFKLSLTRCR